jgi:hypothetical protein
LPINEEITNRSFEKWWDEEKAKENNAKTVEIIRHYLRNSVPIRMADASKPKVCGPP